MALKKGEAMLEFFSMLPILKEMYEKDGYRMAKMMWKKLKDEKRISMSYEQFNIHFKQNLVPQKDVIRENKNTLSMTPQNDETTLPKIGDENWKPHRAPKSESALFEWKSTTDDNVRTL